MIHPSGDATRRALFRFGGGVIIGLGLPAARAGAAARLDPNDQAQHLKAYMKMRGALDDRLNISCIQCQYYGVVDAKMTPFYDLVAATFSRFRPARDGGYEGVSFEIEYFIDRDTGGVLDRWLNPYTGETVVAKHTDSKPIKFAIGADGRPKPPPALVAAGYDANLEQSPFRILGDDVWVTDTARSMVTLDAGPKIRFNESVTMHAKLSDLTDPSTLKVATDTEYLGISSFRTWQNMGARSGHLIGFGVGSMGIALADLPSTWIAASKTRHPEAFSDPAAYLEPLWNTH